MPNQLIIQNSSHSIPIVISLESIDGKTYHLQDKKIAPTETINIIVKGGVKKLSISKEDDTPFWRGVIPANGRSPVIIFPEKAAVKYIDKFLVNAGDIPDGESSRMRYVAIALLLLSIALSLALYYF